MRYFEPTPEQESGFAEWLKSRPENVRLVAEKFPPWELFRLHDKRVFVLSFGEGEDGTVTLTVAVTGEFNLVAFERSVFGIKPEDLEPCDLPAEGELTGSAGLSIDEAKELIMPKVTH